MTYPTHSDEDTGHADIYLSTRASRSCFFFDCIHGVVGLPTLHRSYLYAAHICRKVYFSTKHSNYSTSKYSLSDAQNIFSSSGVIYLCTTTTYFIFRDDSKCSIDVVEPIVLINWISRRCFQKLDLWDGQKIKFEKQQKKLSRRGSTRKATQISLVIVTSHAVFLCAATARPGSNLQRQRSPTRKATQISIFTYILEEDIFRLYLLCYCHDN